MLTLFFFFFNDTATTEIYTLSLHDALPISAQPQTSWTVTPLQVFERHSGFWINLHHTLYQEARQRRASTSRDANAAKPAPSAKTVLAGKGPLTEPEQKAWDDAVAYYAANYANKDLLFT